MNEGDILKIKDIYNYSYNYLINISKDYVSKEKIDLFINNSDLKIINSLVEVFELLLVILQDFQMYPKVINYSKREKDIKDFIHFPDIKYCASLDPIKMSEYFISKYNSNSKRCWLQYSKGIISGAKYLSQFNNFNEFKIISDSFDSNDMTREAYALFLSSKINNMGFAVACNWLKELGYKNYPKPDVHMKDICHALKLIDDNKNDIDCFEAMIHVSKECNIEPYKLDKVWWLICSGNYYRYNIQLPAPQQNKCDFISSLNE